MAVSVSSKSDLTYPGSEDYFSPSEPFPEYPFSDLATSPNRIYPLVREVFAQLGLDSGNFGKPEWNPLGRYIQEGQSVFALCNFVYHRRPRESVEAFFSKCTHGAVLRAVLDYVLLAVGPEGKVRFGNAAVLSCNWEQVLKDTGADRVAEFYRAQGRPVSPVDLRLHVQDRDRMGKVVHVERRQAEGKAVELDLGENSLLDELPGGHETGARFRVSDYDPDRIAAFHSDGSHRYVIAQPVLDSDVVLSIPKMKTHEKVGITCALKGYVGMVGHKDCLAHHRFGGPGRGGDEFPRGGIILTPVAHFHDWLNRRPHGSFLQGPLQVLERVIQKSGRLAGCIMGGSWYGNDTAWRMTLDLVRIAHFSDRNGSIHETPQRKNLVFLDGIVAGEGEGPLKPSPARAGTLLFADDVAEGDRVTCRLMGFNPAAIRLVDRAPELLPKGDPEIHLILNGRKLGEGDITPVLNRAFIPARGWRGHIEDGAS